MRIVMALIGTGAFRTLAAAQECRPPERQTEFHAPQRLRQALEAFRIRTERAREATEEQRSAKALERDEYRESIARYRENVAAYRAGVVHAKDLPCPFATNEILALRVLPGRLDPQYDLEHGNDVVRLRVAYYYTGDRGDAVSIGAITLLEGQSTGYWGYRPHQLMVGFDVAEVRLSMNNDAPDGYRSDAISADMFIHGKNVFRTRAFPYVREWRRRKSDE